MLDLYSGAMSLRRLGVLIRHTPGDDLLWAVIDADDKTRALTAEHRHLLDRATHYDKQKEVAQ